MKNDGVQLIQRTLVGDQSAFNTLVQKYEKSVHAFVWRKIGDYHIQEIAPLVRKIRLAYGITVNWSPDSKHIAWTTGVKEEK